jgi:hypothetical protein
MQTSLHTPWWFPCLIDKASCLCLLLLASVLLPQVRAREEELLNLTSLHTATKASADKRIAALEGRVTKLLEANR